MILDPRFFLGQVVLQPTTICNLNCSYCYLPHRKEPYRMGPEITKALAAGISEVQSEQLIPIIWHGGEPLMTGLDHFERLLEPLEDLRTKKRIVHWVQTNATRIDERWCELFQKYEIEVGISLDGPAVANHHRADWQGRGSFDKVMSGVQYLKRYGIPFTCIAVITNESLKHARNLYHFFQELGCTSLGINFEERIGINTTSADDEDGVSSFWNELFAEWKESPTLSIREFRNIIRWMGSEVGEVPKTPDAIDIFPTISWNGDVVLLSPELLSAKSYDHDNFIVGNILQRKLVDILKSGQNAGYVREYLDGVEMCSLTCEFFGHCHGGQAANKFYELNKIAATETEFCRNSVQKPMKTVVGFLE